MRKVSPCKLEKAEKLYKSGVNITNAARIAGITRAVVSRYLDSAGIREIPQRTSGYKKDTSAYKTYGRYADYIKDDDFGLKVGDKVKIHITCSGTDEKEKDAKGIIEGIYNWFFLIKTDKGYYTTVLKTALGNDNTSHMIRRI